MSTKRSPFLRYLALIIFLVLYGVIMFELKLVVAFLPNVEPVTAMTIALTAALGPWGFLSVYTYVFCELATYGIGIWNVMYLYVWAALALLIWVIRRPVTALDDCFKCKGILMTVVFTVIAAVFGISFGTLCAVPYIFVDSLEYAIAWVLNGISFDVIHCVGNAVSTAVLFYPIYWLLKGCKSKLIRV